MKVEFYKTSTIPALLYGAKYWATRMEYPEKLRMNMVETRMLKKMGGKHWKDKTVDEHIHGLVKSAIYKKKIREDKTASDGFEMLNIDQ